MFRRIDLKVFGRSVSRKQHDAHQRLSLSPIDEPFGDQVVLLSLLPGVLDSEAATAARALVACFRLGLGIAQGLALVLGREFDQALENLSLLPRKWPTHRPKPRGGVDRTLRT